jgi:hypothetical protein
MDDHAPHQGATQDKQQEQMVSNKSENLETAERRKWIPRETRQSDTS